MVEEMPIMTTDGSEFEDDSIYKKAKEYDHTIEYQFGLYVDAKDSVGRWWVCQIVEIQEDNDMVRVHYDGWSEKYDELISLKSSKIAPFRYFTTCYTGQNVSAYRDFHFNPEVHKRFIKELEDIYIKGFEVLGTPRRVNQYLRGELYLYVDSILTLFLNTTERELGIYYEFMSHVFTVIQLWLKTFPLQMYKGYQDSKKYKKLFLVDFDTALSRCGYEFIDILAKWFGCCSRSLSLFKNFKEVYLFRGEFESVPYYTERGFGFMYSLMNMFGELRGFESFRQFLVDGHPQLGNSVIPLSYMHKLLIAIKHLYQRSNSQLAAEILEMIKEGVTNKISNITDKEIQEIPPILFINLFGTMRAFYLARRTSYRTVEELELLFMKKLLNWEKIEHKIKALDELNKIKKKVAVAFGKETDKDSNESETEVYWLTYDYFIRWVLKNEIVDTIFIDSVHPELIRRSYPILSMLAREDKLDKAYLEVIWQNARDNHEDTVRATLELIQKLAAYLNMGW
jgi:hypothetical protein